MKCAIFEEHSSSCVVYSRFSGTLFPVSMIDGESVFWRSHMDVSVNNGHIWWQYILLVSDDYNWLKGRSFVGKKRSRTLWIAHCFTLCLPGISACFLSSADFIQNQLEKLFQENRQSVNQFGSRPGPTFCRAWSGPKRFAKVIRRRHYQALIASVFNLQINGPYPLSWTSL